MPEEDREGIFERFRRGSKVVKTERAMVSPLNALALALARSHGGDLTLVRSDGEWNEFALTLPVV